MGGADEYPGSDLMREANNGIVLVIIQYRLGIFGEKITFTVVEAGPVTPRTRLPSRVQSQGEWESQRWFT